MLIAALVAVTSFAQPVKKQQMTFNQSPTELQRTPSLKPFQTVAMPQTAKATALKAKKAPKRLSTSLMWSGPSTPWHAVWFTI